MNAGSYVFSHSNAVGIERLWSNPKMATFDWLLKNGFISCHFQILNFFWIFVYTRLKMILK